VNCIRGSDHNTRKKGYNGGLYGEGSMKGNNAPTSKYRRNMKDKDISDKKFNSSEKHNSIRDEY